MHIDEVVVVAAEPVVVGAIGEVVADELLLVRPEAVLVEVVAPLDEVEVEVDVPLADVVVEVEAVADDVPLEDVDVVAAFDVAAEADVAPVVIDVAPVFADVLPFDDVVVEDAVDVADVLIEGRAPIGVPVNK